MSVVIIVVVSYFNDHHVFNCTKMSKLCHNCIAQWRAYQLNHAEAIWLFRNASSYLIGIQFASDSVLAKQIASVWLKPRESVATLFPEHFVLFDFVMLTGACTNESWSHFARPTLAQGCETISGCDLQLAFALSCLKVLTTLHHWPLRLDACSLNLIPRCYPSNRMREWLYVPLQMF